jgi:hypothetical protein
MAPRLGWMAPSPRVGWRMGLGHRCLGAQRSLLWLRLLSIWLQLLPGLWVLRLAPSTLAPLASLVKSASLARSPSAAVGRWEVVEVDPSGIA